LLSLAVIFSLHAIAAPQQVTVKQLRQTLAGAKGKTDRQVATQISGLQLTERLSRDELTRLSRALPGERSKTALRAIAVASAFSDPPASGVLPDPSPDAKAQKKILTRAAKLVGKQADTLPSFLVTRTTTHFQDAEVYPYSNWIEYYTPGNLRMIDRQTDDIRCYAGGDEAREMSDEDVGRHKESQSLNGMTPWGFQTIWGNITGAIPNPSPNALKPAGAFGPLLKTVMADIPQAQVEWGYWERTASARLAVFQFRVPQEDSHYEIAYGSSTDPASGEEPVVATTAYHGEVAIDPATGQVARLVLICDLAPGQTISKANLELEYASVDIAGQSYLLPVRGVSASTISLAAHNYTSDSFGDGQLRDQIDHFTVTSMDDLAFMNYRIYRPRIRILPLKSLDRPSN
jgi:hypothetical protein